MSDAHEAHIPPYLPISPHISPYLPISPHISAVAEPHRVERLHVCKGVCGEAPQRRLADWSEEEVAPLLEEGVHLGLGLGLGWA